MAHDVFVSYGHQDKPVADAVCARLESRGIRCWIAPRDGLPGREYGEALVDAIGESQALVLVFSSHANLSRHVSKEVELAVSGGIPVLPFRIEEVAPSGTLHYFIGSVHWLDAMTPPMDRHLDRLADSVGLLIQRTETSRETPAVTVSPATTVRPARRYRGFAVLTAAALGGLALWQILPVVPGDPEPIVGCWSWPGGFTLTVDPGGSVDGPVDGQWQRIEEDRYRIEWPPFEDVMVLSADGAQLSGRNNWGSPIAATRATVTDRRSLIGEWLYAGQQAMITADGRIVTGSYNGTWNATNAEGFRIVWTHRFIDDLRLSPGGNLLQGRNNYGVPLEATRATCAP